MISPDFFLRTESGFLAHGQRDIGGQDFGWGVARFDDGSPLEIEAATLPAPDGEYLANTRYRSRLIRVSGDARARSWSELQGMRDQLAALPRSGDMIWFDQYGQTRWVIGGAQGRGAFEARYDMDVPYADWMVEWRCQDPMIYGEKRTVSVPIGEKAVIRHRGTVETWPTIEITGPVNAGLRLTIENRNLIINRDIKSGERISVTQHDVRSNTGGVLTRDITGLLGRVPAFRGTTIHSSGSGHGQIRAWVYDTWV